MWPEAQPISWARRRADAVATASSTTAGTTSGPKVAPRRSMTPGSRPASTASGARLQASSIPRRAIASPACRSRLARASGSEGAAGLSAPATAAASAGAHGPARHGGHRLGQPLQGLAQHLGTAAHGGRRVVELVGDAGGQGAQLDHPLSPHNLVAGLLPPIEEGLHQGAPGTADRLLEVAGGDG